MAKMQLEFEGFNEVIARLTKLEGNVKKTTEEALRQSERIARKKAGAAMSSHNKTYRTIRTLKHDQSVNWAGTTASIEVGFDIHNGGLASVFLMYGTPRVKKDQKLYNAFYGAQTKKEVQKLQEDIFMREIRKMGG